MKPIINASELEVRNVPEPEFTKSWHPVSHGKVLDALQLSLKNAGMGVVKSRYSLHGRGMNMFGTWVLDQEIDGRSWMIGIRNSMQKQFAIGVCAGNLVTVCSNMIFSGQFISFRRHTSGVDLEELRLFSERSLQTTFKNIGKLGDWHSNLKTFPFKTEEQFKATAFDALKSKVIPMTKLYDFLDCYKEEVALNEPSLYTFHGGITRMIRGDSMFGIAHSNNKLTRFCDDYIQKAA